MRYFTKAKVALLAAIVVCVAPLAALAGATPANAAAYGCNSFTDGSTNFQVCYSSFGTGSKTMSSSVAILGSGRIDGHLEIQRSDTYGVVSGCSTSVQVVTVALSGPDCTKPNTALSYRATWEGTGGIDYSTDWYYD